MFWRDHDKTNVMATHLAVFCFNQTCEKMLSNLQRNWSKSLINRLKSQTHCQGINKPTTTTRSQICQNNMWKIQKITFVNKYNTKNKSNTISLAVQKNACLTLDSLFRPGGYFFLLYKLCAHTFFFYITISSWSLGAVDELKDWPDSREQVACVGVSFENYTHIVFSFLRWGQSLDSIMKVYLTSSYTQPK